MLSSAKEIRCEYGLSSADCGRMAIPWARLWRTSGDRCCACRSRRPTQLTAFVDTIDHRYAHSSGYLGNCCDVRSIRRNASLHENQSANRPANPSASSLVRWGGRKRRLVEPLAIFVVVSSLLVRRLVRAAVDEHRQHRGRLKNVPAGDHQARLPDSIVPNLSDTPRIAAALGVTAFNPSSGGKP